jgi:ribonuclease P protein component
LTRGAELQRVIREGKRYRTSHLDVRATPSPLGHPRVGFVVPKFNRTAVQRNRLKRQLRELTRLRLLRELPAVDVVVRVRRETYDVPFTALTQDVDRVRSGLVRLFAE